MPNSPVEFLVKMNKGLWPVAMDKSAAVLREVVNTAQEYAKQDSPFLTGHNRSTITWDESKSGNEVPGFRLYTQSGYGGHLELGTRRRPARPYMEPAIRRAIDEAGARSHG